MEEQEKDRLIRTYEILDKRHIHDEELLISRTANFLLVNSFLVIAFATFVIQGDRFFYFSLVLPCVGILMCFVFAILFWIQLITVKDIWMKVEDEIEQMEVFTISREGKCLAPNQRHDERFKKGSIGAFFWRYAPSILILITFSMWTAFLVFLIN